MANRTCTSCGHVNDAKAERCEECGVHFPKRKRTVDDTGIAGIPDTCSWVSGRLACCYPPAWSDNTRGGGPFFCRFHARESDPVVATEIAQMSQDFTAPTVDSLFAETQRQTDDWMLATGRARRPGESSRNYATRCSGTALALLSGVGKPKAKPRQWALDIIAEHAAGLPITDLQLRIAREAVDRMTTSVEKEVA